MRALVVIVLLLASSAQAKLKVVATVSDLGVIAREIGGDEVEVQILARPTQDPHFVDAKPSMVVTLSRADALLLVGMDLEVGWLPVLLTGSRNGNIQPGAPGYIDCSGFITAKEIPVGKLDRAMGDVHPGGNPHYTRDPQNAVRLARGIGERLAQLDPEHASQFRARAAAVVSDLETRIEQWKKTLEPYQGTLVVPYHRSWIYFVSFAGMQEAAYVEPKPGLAPSAGHVAQVLQVIRTRKVPLIIQENFYPASTSELLAKSGGAKLLRVEGMAKESQTYAQFMDSLVQEVAAALSARRQP